MLHELKRKAGKLLFFVVCMHGQNKQPCATRRQNASIQHTKLVGNMKLLLKK